MGQKVSMREYAKIRGVHLNAVQTAVKSGRIHKTTDGKIDVEKANQEWLQNTDPSKSRHPESFFEHGNENRKVSPSSFQQAKTADVYYRAMIAKAKLKKMTGETIDRKKPECMLLTSDGLCVICLFLFRHVMELLLPPI